MNSAMRPAETDEPMDFPDSGIREQIEALLGRDIGAEQGRTASFAAFSQSDLNDIRAVADYNFAYGVLYVMFRSVERPTIGASKGFCEELLRPSGAGFSPSRRPTDC